MSASLVNALTGASGSWLRVASQSAKRSSIPGVGALRLRAFAHHHPRLSGEVPIITARATLITGTLARLLVLRATTSDVAFATAPSPHPR